MNAASVALASSRRMPVSTYTASDRISSAMNTTSRSFAIAIMIMPAIENRSSE